MELRHLRYFVAVAEEENITRAAERLHVSQPALSRQVRDLEQELGFNLLKREAKSVHLTRVGRVFLVESRAVLARADQAIERAKAVAAKGQQLNIGYAPSLSVEILPRTLRVLRERFPEVRVELHDLSTEEMVAQLRSKKLDLALVVRPSARMARGLKFVELGRYPISIALSPRHPLAKTKTVTLDQLAGHRLVGYSRKEYPEYHDLLESVFKGRRLEPILEQGSVMSLIAEVEAGRGVALVPSSLSCMVGPRLKIIPLAPAPIPIVVGALLRVAETSTTTRDFIDAALA